MNRAELRAAIARKGISKTALAEALGISRTALGQKLTGVREFKESEIKALVKVLGLSAGDVDTLFFLD